MIPKLTKSWWLLALCGFLYALSSAMIFLLQNPDGRLILRTLPRSGSTVTQMGMLALAAGACTIAAAVPNLSKGNSWLLALNGLACISLGLLFSLGASRPVAFRTIALAIAVMAMSIGAYELATARRSRGHLVDEWLLGAAGVVSVGFALCFLGFVLRWIKLEAGPSSQTFYWLGSYFGFSAICMMGLALRRSGLRVHLHRTPSRAMPIG